MSSATCKAAPIAARNKAALLPAFLCCSPQPSRQPPLAPSLQGIFTTCSMMGGTHATVFPPACCLAARRTPSPGYPGAFGLLLPLLLACRPPSSLPSKSCCLHGVEANLQAVHPVHLASNPHTSTQHNQQLQTAQWSSG